MRKVLIIDDDKINWLITQKAVKVLMPDCDCISAYNAEQGIKLAKEKLPDCILLDIVMPDKDGFETLEILKNNTETKHIPVVLLSSVKKDTQSRIKALNNGADAFLTKPCDPEELVALIHVMFRIKDAEDKLRFDLEESNLKFAEVVDLQDNALVIYDVKNEGHDFIIAAFNAAAEKLENVTRANVIGKNVLDVFPAAKEFGILEVFKAVYKTGQPASHPITFYDGDNAQGWRENYVYKISSEQIVSVYRDITERKQNKLKLEESELKYRTLADYNYAWEYWKNEKGEYNYVSPSCIDICGYPAEKFIQNPEFIIEITHPDFRVKTLHHYTEEQKKEGAHEFEYKIKHADGTERWILHKCRPIYSEQNVFLGRRGINKDVTKYKQALERVNTLNNAIEHTKDVVFMTDINKVFTYVNPEFTHLYGFTKEEVIGKRSPNILDSGTLSKEEHKALFNTLLEKQSIYVEYINKCKNGKLIDIEASADPILNDEGKIIGFLAMQRDISARKKAEKTQNIILNISKAANQCENLDELFVFIQKEMNKVIDCTNFFVAFYNEEKEHIELPFIRGVESNIKSFPAGKTLTSWVIRNQKSLLATSKVQKELEKKSDIELKGKPAAVWLGVPLMIANKIIGVLAVQNYENENAYNQQDADLLEIISYHISTPIERLQKEKRLLNALEKATESDRLKSAFLATMSHELRTPLNAIIGFSSLVDEDTETQDVIFFCKKIFDSGHHLLDLINNMFELSFVENEKVRLNIKRIELKESLKTIYEIVYIEKANLAKQHLEINLNLIDEQIPFWIYSDEGKLTQILINILKNALKYTKTGSVDFGFEQIIEDKKPMLKFYVKDTGIGIPEDKKDIVFDEFRQVDDSHTRQHEGIGIGLAISKKLVRFFGGNIWFDSELNKGTTFYFTIPYEKG